VNSPQNARAWKSSTARIFGLVSLTLGCCLALLILVVLYGSPFRLWYPGLPLLASLLFLLLAANLIYIGWHTIARGAVPIGPRLAFHRSDIVKAKAAIASMNAHLILICVVALFAGCAAEGAHFMISLQHWASDFRAGHASSLGFYQIFFGRSLENSVTIQWVFWALHFPAAMSVAILAATVLGLIRERPGAHIAAAIGVLFLAGPVTVFVCVWLLLTLWMTGLLFLAYYLVYGTFLMPAFLLVVALSVSRAALARGTIVGIAPERDMHWSSRFFRTTLIAGLPGGLVVGILLAALLHDDTWTVGGIEITFAALYGASLVYADRRDKQ
jgi:hypothetical protein